MIGVAIVSARRVMTLCFLSERLLVGRQVIVEAVGLFLLEVAVGCGGDAAGAGRQDG